ncbi:MAG: dTDP-4-dehydrorhamnose reductase [Phycisphaerales bacterium]|nr:dTDP-4-dehydrorhamnose reductase [Phycisphaerales bacterium]
MPFDRTLILGSGGMLGRSWAGLLTAHGLPFEALDLGRLNLEDTDAVRRFDVSGYSLLLNCAAWTAVDDAETSYERCHAVNATAVGELARKCADSGVRFVTYSTDYVFHGDAAEPYRTTGSHDPVNAYGRSKAAGEAMLRGLDSDWLCIRTSWVYAPWGKNFVRTIAGAARTRPELRVVDDQRGRPTSAEGLARTSLGLIMAGARGFAHATDGGECSWFDFAREIVRLTGAPAVVHPCTSDAYPRPAKRPAYSVLDLSETERLIGPMTPWQAALADVVRRLAPD